MGGCDVHEHSSSTGTSLSDVCSTCTVAATTHHRMECASQLLGFLCMLQRGTYWLVAGTSSACARMHAAVSLHSNCDRRFRPPAAAAAGGAVPEPTAGQTSGSTVMGGSETTAAAAAAAAAVRFPYHRTPTWLILRMGSGTMWCCQPCRLPPAAAAAAPAAAVPVAAGGTACMWMGS